MLDLEQLKKKFPANFPTHLLPPEAKEESIVVYRICKSGQVDEESFLPSYLEIGRTKDFDEKDIGEYSLSAYEKIEDAEKRCAFFGNYHPEAIIAVGTTDPSCGLSQRTRERKKMKRGKSHVDWWIYENAKPHQFFKKYEEGDD
ncbi:MAG: hypothetical protein KH009_03725 [Clostridiales bacterium]|nr:hypothetical protein [Clostridiales bacterium]